MAWKISSSENSASSIIFFSKVTFSFSCQKSSPSLTVLLCSSQNNFL
jgi:hypothetical protein